MKNKQSLVAIQGRVDPKDICTVAVYLKEKGANIDNRSDLVRKGFSAFSALLQKLEPSIIDEIENNHDAQRLLHRLGLEWPGERNRKDWVRVLQDDVLSDLSVEELEQVEKFAKGIREKDNSETVVEEEEEEDPLGIAEELKEVEE